MQEGLKRNRALLTARLIANLHSIHIDLPAFSNTPLRDVKHFLIEATSKAGYLERRVGMGSLDLAPSTTITSPASPNVSIWDALQIITSANNLRFNVEDREGGVIELYPPQAESVIHPPAPKMEPPPPTPAGPGVSAIPVAQPVPATPATFNYVSPPKPLKVAIDSDDLEAAKHLLDNGARPEEFDMVEALAHGRNRFVKLIWEHRGYYCSPLAYAVSQGTDIADVDAMLKKNNTVEPPEDQYITPLAIAAENGNLPMVKMLLAHGADPNYVTAKGQANFSPLQQAVGIRNPEIVTLLLDRGAHPGIMAVDMALGSAAKSFPDNLRAPAIAIVKLLAQSGAFETMHPKMKGRLLNEACLTDQNPELVQLLLAHGYSPREIGPDGKTPVIELVRRASEGKNNWPANPDFQLILGLLEAADKGEAPKSDTGTQSPNNSTSSPSTTEVMANKSTTLVSEAEAKEKGIAAIVNDKPLFWSEIANDSVTHDLYERAKSSGSAIELRGVLDEAIERELVIQDAEASGYHVPQSDLDERVDYGVKGFGGSKEAFVANLNENGSSLEQFTEQNRRDEVYEYMYNLKVDGPTKAYWHGLPPSNPGISPADAKKAIYDLCATQRAKLETDWINSLRVKASVQTFGGLVSATSFRIER